VNGSKRSPGLLMTAVISGLDGGPCQADLLVELAEGQEARVPEEGGTEGSTTIGRPKKARVRCGAGCMLRGGVGVGRETCRFNKLDAHRGHCTPRR
jgi:hypothetical protein